MNPLNEVFALKEAAQLWGLAVITLRHSCLKGRFKPGEFKRSGDVWLVTRKGMIRLYGNMKEEYVMLEKFGWETIVHYMDDELREQVHLELAPCTNAEFLARYMELHKEKFGEDFTIN